MPLQSNPDLFDFSLSIIEGDKNNKKQNECLFVRMISDPTNSNEKYLFLS